MTRHVCALAFACVVSAGAASAQTASATGGDPSETARFKWGAVRFTPSIAVSNVGVDNNVFYEAQDAKRDTTAAVGPALSLWVKMGKSRFSGKTSAQYLYFKTYDNQRAWNTSNDGRWELPLSRITPFAVGSFSNTKDRPGFEIDSRARLKTSSYGLGTSLRLSGKTSIVLAGTRSIFKFDDNQPFLGADLAQTLNRRSDSESMHVRTQLTPLTAFVVRTEAVQDRFETETIRNTDSYSVMPGFELRPQALISGEAFVGVRRFTTLRTALPDFTGIVASVGTTYTAKATQIEVKVARDLNYSYEVLQPYYALTNLGVTVTERITRSWDVVGRGGWQSLAYRNVTNVAGIPARVDRGSQVGAGLGYRLRPTVRLGFDAIYYRRQSPGLTFRDYDGFRFGGSVSYGLQQ